MRDTKISWCDHTFNPWWGCKALSAGCANCYARKLAKRFGYGWAWESDKRRLFKDGHWSHPHTWNREATRRERVFCASMADVCDPHAPAEALARLWKTIRETPNLDWLLLTKRPERYPTVLPPDWKAGWPNVWLGTTVENQTATTRVDTLRSVPAHVRFLSCEPLIGPVEVSLEGIHWVIAGGESGTNERPIQLDWLRSLRDQSATVGAAFFLKQLGGHPDKRDGDKAVLDGSLHYAFPVTNHTP